MSVYKITDAMKKDKQNRLDKICEKINKSIEYAVKHGRHECAFPWIDCPYYSELYAMYTSEGYEISPTGYIGGVYQHTNTIRW